MGTSLLYLYSLFIKIAGMSITAGVTILAVLLVRLSLKRAPKVFSYALWGIVLFRLLCPVSFASPFSLLRLAEAPAARLEAIEKEPLLETEQRRSEALKRSEASADALSGNTFGHTLLSASKEDASKNVQTAVLVLMAVWSAGIMVLLIVNLTGYIRIRFRVMRSMPLYDNVFLADEIDTPFCLGIVKPRIYLPSSLEAGEREYIILHEQHHIRRGDHMIKVAAFLALCVHWLNPLVWLAFVLAGKDMEMSCDEAVMRRMKGDIRAEYSASLLHLATGRRVFASSPLAFGEGDPKHRIRNIMNYKRPGVWIVLGGAAVCIIVSFALLADPEKINLFGNKGTDGLECVMVYFPDGSSNSYSDPEHVSAIADFMQTMDCHKTSVNNKDGFGIQLDFVYTDGSRRKFTFQGDRKVSVGDSIEIAEEVRKYNEEDGKYGVVIDGAYVTVDDYLPQKKVVAAYVGCYKCSRDYSGELEALLDGFLPERNDPHSAHTYFANENGAPDAPTEEMLPTESLTVTETADITEDHAYIAPTDGGTERELPAEAINVSGEQGPVIIYTMEGMTEEVPAQRVSGDGYSLLIPKEGWGMIAPELWCMEEDPRISIWVAEFQGEQKEKDFSEEIMTEHLYNMGFRMHPISNIFMKEDKDAVTMAEIRYLQGTGGWFIFYRYPGNLDAEEGWAIRLKTIAASFTVSEESNI